MNDPLIRLREAISVLHLEAGKPSGRELAARSGGLISHTAVSAVLRCERLPTWRCLEPVIRLLGGDREVYKELWIAAERAEPFAARDSGARGVLPDGDVFDFATVERRLAAKPHDEMRRLTELRWAAEPTASFLAAERFSEQESDDLAELARRLEALGRDPLFVSDSADGAAHREKYRVVDVEFHSAILRGCRNDFFRGLIGHVTLALNYRIKHDRIEHVGVAGTGGNKPFPAMPTSLALWLHRGLATAVQQRRCSAAEAFSRAILAEIREGPLPESVAQALRVALNCLDPRLMGADWPMFAAEIKNLLANEVWPGR